MDVVQCLIDARASIHDPEPLPIACEYGNDKVALLLIQAGASLGRKMGEQELHWASVNSLEYVVQILSAADALTTRTSVASRHCTAPSRSPPSGEAVAFRCCQGSETSERWANTARRCRSCRCGASQSWGGRRRRYCRENSFAFGHIWLVPQG